MLLWIYDIVMLGNAYHKKSLGKRESIQELSIVFTLHLFSFSQSEMWNTYNINDTNFVYIHTN